MMQKIFKISKRLYRNLYYKLKVFDVDNVNISKSFPEFSKQLFLDLSFIDNLISSYLHFKVNSFLEVGCGYSRLTPFLLKYTDNLVSIDKEKKLIDLSKKLFPFFKYYCLDITKRNKYKIGKFDFILIFTVLQHISNKDIKKACEYISKLLTYNGYLLIYETIEKKDYRKNLHNWVRTLETYCNLFNFDVITYEKKKNNHVGVLFRKR